MDSTGSLEDQLEAVKGLARDIAMKKEALRKVEELGEHIEEALIFDNKWAIYLNISHNSLLRYPEIYWADCEYRDCWPTGCVVRWVTS